MDCRTNGVVIAEGGVELLLVAGVAKAKRQIERICDVQDVVRERREVCAVLEITVVGGAQIIQVIKRRERRQNIRAG